MTKPVAIVTGASQGTGKATALVLCCVGRDTASDLPQPDQVHWEQYQAQ